MSLADVPAQPGRPSPEALLAAARVGGRGKLKIFLGAAPGVGKTYEMLEFARARKRDGVDVVVGIVETHGRAETAALLEGLDVVPRQRVDYRGHHLEEMDLDAILARRPQLVLVDELAHTNAPGSRHPKRHLDAEELLAAGIDVYSTLNVQHVESLNDVIAQITGIRVRETVPDAILDQADDIEVVDLSPTDLIQRLHEGKVYVPKQAERALKHYFSPGNLTALRELALRRAAERVDGQLLTHMQAHAISGPWPAGERLLVCVSEDLRAAGLVRYAKRLADRLHAPWTALYVESARSHRLSEAERDRVADVLRLAERLGAESMTIPGGGRIADDVIGHARASNVTQIIVGKSDRPRWFELINGSVVHDLVRKAGAISVDVISGADRQAVEARAIQSAPGRPGERFRSYAATLLALAAALAVGYLTRPVVGVESVDLIFLLAIVGIATAYGLVPSLVASVLASLGYNFFFLPPLYTFTIADPTNVSALVFFLIVAVVVSNLAARIRVQITTARNRARTTQALYAFSRKLAGIIALDDLLWAAAYQIAAALKVDVVLLLPEDGRLAVKVGYPPEDELDEADIGAAKWSFETNQTAGHGSATLPGAKRLFLPLRTGSGPLGVVGISRRRASFRLSPDEGRLLDALMDQTAVAAARIGLAGEMDKARLDAETERLRSALLTSLSHDLKTPLASIIGAASALRRHDAIYDTATRGDLAGTIESEAERLNRFVANLLDMTRLESGPIAIRREAADIGEIVGTAIGRTARQLADHRVDVNVAVDLPLLNLDVVLFEQVLVNLLDNAAKYAPKGTAISVAARRLADAVTVTVTDMGPGIPVPDLERIFDKFYRAGGRDGRLAGTGLGLSICRGFVEAMGGSIAAANRPDHHGAVFTVTFPATTFARALTAPEVGL